MYGHLVLSCGRSVRWVSNTVLDIQKMNEVTPSCRIFLKQLRLFSWSRNYLLLLNLKVCHHVYKSTLVFPCHKLDKFSWHSNNWSSFNPIALKNFSLQFCTCQVSAACRANFNLRGQCETVFSLFAWKYVCLTEQHWPVFQYKVNEVKSRFMRLVHSVCVCVCVCTRAYTRANMSVCTHYPFKIFNPVTFSINFAWRLCYWRAHQCHTFSFPTVIIAWSQHCGCQKLVRYDWPTTTYYKIIEMMHSDLSCKSIWNMLWHFFFLEKMQQKHRGHTKTIIIPVPTGHRDYFSGVKRPQSKADHSLPYSAEVKNEWSCTSTPSHIPVRCGQEQLYLLEFFMAWQPQVGQGLLIVEASWSHSDTQHSVALLWMSDQPVTETSTRQHTTLTRDRPPCLWQNSNPQLQQSNNNRSIPWIVGHWIGTLCFYCKKTRCT